MTPFAKNRWAQRLVILTIGVLTGVAILVASGCGPVKRYLKPQPPLAQCDAKCYVPCVGQDQDTGIRWDGSPVDARMWDVLAADVTLPLADKLRQCEVARKACQQCLDRLKAEGVIR